MSPIVGSSLHFGRAAAIPVSKLFVPPSSVLSDVAGRVGLKPPAPITDEWSLDHPAKPTPLNETVAGLIDWVTKTLMPRIEPRKAFYADEKTIRNPFGLLSRKLASETVVSYPFIFKWMHNLAPYNVDRIHTITEDRDGNHTVVGFSINAHHGLPEKILKAKNNLDGSSILVFSETNHVEKITAIKEYLAGDRIVLVLRQRPLSPFIRLSLQINDQEPIIVKARANRLKIPHSNHLLELEKVLDHVNDSETRGKLALLQALRKPVVNDADLSPIALGLHTATRNAPRLAEV